MTTKSAALNAADVIAYDAAKTAHGAGPFPTFRNWMAARTAGAVGVVPAKPARAARATKSAAPVTNAAPATRAAKPATRAPRAAPASADVPLSAIARELGMSGKRARVILRRVYPGNNGAKWVFTAKRAAEIRDVLRNARTDD